MAVVKKIKPSIKSADHLYNSIDYITNPQKASQVSYLNCIEGNSYDLAKQFYTTRNMANKNSGILSHHFSQSFSPDDNLTPEQVHEIGLALAEKFASHFQVIVSTHIDKDHIHNHFIVNSVNPLTNKKFIDNKASLNFMRSESDKLCRTYNSHTIDKESKYKGIDQTTYQLAKQGKSWKVNLVKDLDGAMLTCKTKEEFIEFFKERNYSIKYKDIHITIQKNGEKKAIRVDTLAKQFGAKYGKKNIDNILGVVPKILPQKKKIKGRQQKYLNEYERYEKEYFKNPENIKTLYDKNLTSKKLFNTNPLVFTLNLIRHLFLSSQTKYAVKNKKTKYRVAENNFNQNHPFPYKRYGNISIKELKAAPGNTAKIKIYSYQLPKLITQPFFYATYIDVKTGIATVYLKEKDLIKLSTALELPDQQFFVKQNEIIQNKKIYRKLKNTNKSLEYLIVSPEQKQQLYNLGFEFAWFEKIDGYNITFSPKNKEQILNTLFPQRKAKPEVKKETSYQKNGRINAELKAASKQTGQKLVYKIVSPMILHELEKTDIKYASFRKEDGKINIVFLEADNLKIQTALNKHNNTKKNKG